MAIARSQDNNQHLKQFLQTKWYALPAVFTEQDKANPKSEACKELKNLLWGAVTGRHKRAKTAAKDNYQKQQAQRAKRGGASTVSGAAATSPSDVQILGGRRALPAPGQGNKRSRADRSPYPSPSGQPAKRPNSGGQPEVITLEQPAPAATVRKSYAAALNDTLDNPLSLQVVRVIRDKDGSETITDVNGDDWRDNLFRAWDEKLQEQINLHMANVAQLEKAKAEGTARQDEPEPWFPSFLDTIYREGKIYLVPADEDSMAYAQGIFEDLKVLNRSFRAVPCHDLPDTVVLAAKIPGHYLPVNPQAEFGKTQFLSGLPFGPSSRFHKVEQFGAGGNKRYMLRVTKDLIPVLKAAGGRNRRPGCIKLGSGNYELWVQNSRLVDIDTEAIRYEKRDMSK